MCLIFVGEGYPQKLFNLEHFPIYGILLLNKQAHAKAHAIPRGFCN